MYADDGLITSHDLKILQKEMDILTGLFDHDGGLHTNTKKDRDYDIPVGQDLDLPVRDGLLCLDDGGLLQQTYTAGLDILHGRTKNQFAARPRGLQQI